MMDSPARLAGLGLLVVLALAGASRADTIHWYSTWSSSPTEVNSDILGAGKITLSGNPSAVEHDTNSYTTAVNIQTYLAPAAASATFTNAPYELDLTLTDKTSGDSHVFSFTGVFNGTLTALATQIDNSFTSPSTLSYKIGDNFYTVVMGPYAWPDVPNSTLVGAISAQVLVGTSAMPNTVPEPSTLLLSAVGLSLGGMHWLRRGRQRKLALA
jgi:PEP-CTERM motif